MKKKTVFYSWQSDKPNSINRSLIHACLEKAIKQIKADASLTLEPCLDRDTQGRSGSPAISETIFEKILSSDVFVADISFIGVCNSRKMPNPNVLIELGFAASALKWQRVLCIFNQAFGNVEELPFDLRLRRVIQYFANEEESSEDERKRLTGVLKSAITMILLDKDPNQPPLFNSFLPSLRFQLVQILIMTNELLMVEQASQVNLARVHFEVAEERLRDLLLGSATEELISKSRINKLANDLGEASAIPVGSGELIEFKTLLESIRHQASELKAEYTDTLLIGDTEYKAACERIKSQLLKLERLSSRCSVLLRTGQQVRIYDTADSIAKALLEFAYTYVNQLNAEDRKVLLDIGYALRDFSRRGQFIPGGLSHTETERTIESQAKALCQILEEIGFLEGLRNE